MSLLTIVKTDLRLDERLMLKVYRCPSGKLTIGVGRNLEDKGITVREAEYLLDNDIAEVLSDLDRAFPWWRSLTFEQQRGLMNMCFNLGINRLKGFKNMLAALEAHDGRMAAAHALDSKWCSQVGDRARRVAHRFES